MDEHTTKALSFISDNPSLVKGIANMAEAYRKEQHSNGIDPNMEQMAGFIFDTFIDVTTVNGRSPFTLAAMMNVVLAITDQTGLEL